MARDTAQRRAIRRAITDSARPLAPQEILERAQRAVPGLGIATVYRQIRSLLSEGWLRPVELPGAPCRYEREGKGHHHHFHCRSCDRVFEVDACLGELRRLAPPGFHLEAHEIILYGRCERCAEPS
jgi:Fur family ferric uptake transcriptional regulator